MFQATVLSLGIFSDCDQINIVISRLVSWYAEAGSDICIQLQLFPQCQIQRAVPLANGGGHGTFQTNTVFLQVRL